MHWHVPCSPESVDVIRVPPVAVEIPIGEVQQFTQQIEERVEHQVEEAQPYQMVWYLQAQENMHTVYHVSVYIKKECH